MLSEVGIIFVVVAVLDTISAVRAGRAIGRHDDVEKSI
jgi:hypothetical protein